MQAHAKSSHLGAGRCKASAASIQIAVQSQGVLIADSVSRDGKDNGSACLYIGQSRNLNVNCFGCSFRNINAQAVKSVSVVVLTGWSFKRSCVYSSHSICSFVKRNIIQVPGQSCVRPQVDSSDIDVRIIGL